MDDGLRSDGDAHEDARSAKVSGTGAPESISETAKGGAIGGLGGAREGERSRRKSERGAHRHGGGGGDGGDGEERIGGEGEGAQDKRVAIVKNLHKRSCDINTQW